MKHLPVGNHTFESLISGNALYIDKTEYIYKLLQSVKGVYFLSRPRRFGKSLLISTLAALFLGRRDLFEGLWIAEQSDYDFPSYPVIQIDFSQKRIVSQADLEKHIRYLTDKIAHEMGIELTYEAYDGRFAELIEKMGQTQKVVILIDEYDKPLLDNFDNPERDAMKDMLKGFYGVIKASDPYLRFVFLTGVTKYGRTTEYRGVI